jgi:toxin YoeB
MGKYLVEFTTKAIRELRIHFRSGKRSNILKIEQILKELTENPFEGTGNPEPLKYNLAGYWSRRINKKDRIIYKIYEDRVVVLIFSAIGHYGDK